MILKRGFLNNMLAMSALDKLSTSNKMPADIAYRAGRLHAKINKEVVVTRDLWLGLVKKYAILDDKGEIVFKDNKPTFETLEKEKEHDIAFEEMMKEEFEEKVFPLPLAALKECALTPQELIAIEPILCELPA